MNEFPDGSVNPPAQKKTGRLRQVFRALRYIALAVVVGVVVIYNYCMRPAFLQPLIVDGFAKATHGRLEITVEKTSLFTGFQFRNIVVHPPAGFSETPILRAGEINLLYNVFGFFRGKFGIHELSLKDTEVFLEQKNNIYNAAALAKPGKEKPEPEEDEDDKKAGNGIISWFFDVQIFARIALKNFNFTLDALDKTNKTKQYAHLKNFHFGVSLLTNDFSKINTNDIAGMVSLLNTFVIQLNPQKSVSVAYQGAAASVKSNLDLFWLLFYDGQSEKPEFVSRMNIGNDSFPVALGRGKTQNLPFRLGHTIDYEAKEDRLKIEDFNVQFLKETLIALSGTGEKLLKPSRSIKIETAPSRVNLGKLYEVTSQLTGKRDPAFSGFFSIKPTRVSVQGKKIEDQGGLKLERVAVRAGKFNISIPVLEFDHAAEIDQSLKPLPVKTAEAKLRANLNGAALGLDARLAADRKTQVSLYLKGFNIAPFAAGAATGAISTTFNASGDSPQNLAINLRVFSPQLQYFVDRGKSGINRIDFGVRGSVKSSEDFRQVVIDLPAVTFTDKDKEYGTAVDLKSRVHVEKADSTNIKYQLDSLVLSFKELIGTLPAGLQEQIGGLIKTVNPGKTLRADGETNISLVGNEQQIQHVTQIALPDVHVDDIQIKAKARIAPPYTYLDQFTITGLRKALNVSVSGELKDTFEIVEDPATGKKLRTLVKVPDLQYKVELARKEESEILDDTFLVGLFSIAGTAKGNLVNGLVKIDALSFRNQQVKVNKVDLNFPFKHDLRLKKTLNLRAGNKERIIKNYNFNRAYNFTIGNIEIPDPNNSKEWLNLIYSRGKYAAVGASMEYKDNVFVMPVMQLYTLNGVVTISDTLFNLGRLKPSEMEYSSTIQIKDIDLKPLMLKEKADSITDGKLRIDILLTGNRLDKPVENLNGYLSIFRIGPEFAEAVMKAVKPKQSDFVNTIATNAAIPRKIDIELRDGFVYSDIPIKKGAVGTLFFSPDEIKNRRINIPEFFQRISNEASTYRAPASTPGG